MIRALFLALTMMLAAVPAHAVMPDEMLKDPALEARARVIGQELRCLVCQNQSIDDSDATLARDLRVLVRERISAGDSDAKVLDFVVQRYGNYVLLKPPVQGNTLLLWFLPFGLMALGLGLALIYLRQQPMADDEALKEE
ncbi:cytochrome c-type biogenesis protein [Aestuariivirga litoralis]|uniref:cytochrome c-type biogenesis protein n=1 Tax=Aestuariivirga litoralis TaxID=2650924 RepID=UPI0018C5DF45|nr:cytochrome c-type biogenesis protein [Aestuariivirga litoralis]MBG1232442.1 cytochrome c-type biogenesis protein CcmH [Aestuariivirga litoralis]